MLRQLSLRELTGVLGHELSHVQHHDLWVMGLADLFSRLTSLMALFGQFLLLVNLPRITSYNVCYTKLLRSIPRALPGCICVPLGVMLYRCLASPAYLQRYFPHGVGADAFRQAPVAEFSAKDQLQNRYLQDFFGIGAHDYRNNFV